MFRLHLPRVAALSFLVLVSACRPAPGPPTSLPPPVFSTTVGPGDTFEVSVLGEKDLQREYRVQPDGTIDFPYLDRVAVAGLEPQQIVDALKQRFIEKKILTDPQISLIVKQYNSKKVSVIGAVQKPGSLNWTEGMKLIEAISLSGGFTALADQVHVILTRNVSQGKTLTVRVNLDAITEGKQPDIPLQAGDTVKIEQRVF